MRTLTIDGEPYALIVCGSCGVKHLIPGVIYETALEEGGWWHCPNGHQRGFKEGRNEREAVRRERDRLKQEQARLVQDLAKAEAAQRAAEAKVVQIRRRATAGVCPCCNRTFANVQRHMKTKHPNVVPIEQKAG